MKKSKKPQTVTIKLTPKEWFEIIIQADCGLEELPASSRKYFKKLNQQLLTKRFYRKFIAQGK